MFWSFKLNNERYATWGEPRNTSGAADAMPRFDILVNNGEHIYPDDKSIVLMQGDSTFGVGDSIWLMSFLRLIWQQRHNKQGELYFCSSNKYLSLFKNFLPKEIKLIKEYMTWDDFVQFDHFFPSIYYWKNVSDNSDKSWLDNQSLLERLCTWVGIKYDGLEDWNQFTPEHILHPSDEFFLNLGITPGEKYIMIQWHSSGYPKNIPPHTMFKIINHLKERFNYKIVIVGTNPELNKIKMDGVVVTVGKTEIIDLFSIAANASLIICPDSAAVHLAELYKIPCVCIMSTLPPVYIASKYRIPTFIFGSGHCPYSPCGYVHELPLDRCPKGTKDFCAVMNDIRLSLFDTCLDKTILNAKVWNDPNYKGTPVHFYDAVYQPISLTLK